MDKDEILGKMKDLGGKIERKAGELTGDEEIQGDGAAKQVEGKIQSAWGKVKDAARDAVEEIKHKSEEAKLKKTDENEQTDVDKDENVA